VGPQNRDRQGAVETCTTLIIARLELPSFLAYSLCLPPDVRRQGQPLRGHKKWVTSLAFEPLHADPTCTRLASSSKDHTVRQGQGYPEKQMH